MTCKCMLDHSFVEYNVLCNFEGKRGQFLLFIGNTVFDICKRKMENIVALWFLIVAGTLERVDLVHVFTYTYSDLKIFSTFEPP